jgi:hypothetical protein
MRARTVIMTRSCLARTPTVARNSLSHLSPSPPPSPSAPPPPPAAAAAAADASAADAACGMSTASAGAFAASSGDGSRCRPAEERRDGCSCRSTERSVPGACAALAGRTFGLYGRSTRIFSLGAVGERGCRVRPPLRGSSGCRSAYPEAQQAHRMRQRETTAYAEEWRLAHAYLAERPRRPRSSRPSRVRSCTA